MGRMRFFRWLWIRGYSCLLTRAIIALGIIWKDLHFPPYLLH